MTTYKDFIKDYIINIPAIQRDYVQGANANSKKRNEFIDAILDKLQTSGQLNLEFIYGSSKTSEDNKKYFVPIDGQQRLTTLALLGWVLAQLAYTEQERAELSLRAMDYSVRSTTQLFVKHLFESDICLTDDKQKLSDYIKTVPSWFAKKWESDPSICAMLDILDELYRRLKQKQEEIPAEQFRKIANNLFYEGVIVFDSLDMDKYGLTEDLYVKMNARGKHLTDFENWKAEFYGFLKTKYNDEVAKQFSEGIEGDWCDLFWAYAKEEWGKTADKKKRVYPRIDEFFMRFYKYITDTIFMSQTDMEQRAKVLGIDISKVLQTDPNASIFEVYKKPENIEFLFSVLNALVAIQENHKTIDDWLSEILTNTFTSDSQDKRINIFAETDIFRRLICGEEVTLPLRVLFYAILSRAVKYPNEDIEATRDYVRVFWGWVLSKNWRDGSSLIYAYNIRVEDFLETRKIINALSDGPDVFTALGQCTLPSLAKEKQKAGWRNDNKYEAVRILSGHPYLKGNLENIYPALQSLTADEIVDRFIEFAGKSNGDKVCALIPYGFRGVSPRSNYYRFYGMDDHWDYVFTSSDDSVQKAVTSMLLQSGNKTDPTKEEFEYYILKYPEILEPKGYFYMVDNFTVWGLERFTGRRGYNSCPYCRMVVEQMKDSPLRLQQYAADSSHGTLWSELLGLQMECYEAGWQIQIYDETKWKQYPHLMGLDSYIGKKLPNVEEKDRIETAIEYLRSVEDLAKKQDIIP